jgi:prephenate dehydrogenase
MEAAKITIIGCGLIGGSLALALRRRRPDFSIACLDLPERLSAIREAGICDQVGSIDDIASYVPDSSIIVVATPVDSALSTIAKLRPHLRENAIVTDVGSTKKRIMSEAHKLLPEGTHFIGGHPMAGSERSGVEAADPLLFSERLYALCPYPDTPTNALLTMMDFVESLPALPISIDPDEHDRIMAMVSHLPQIISIALMHAALAGDAEHAMLDKLAGRGFLDMTRLAASDFNVWKGILATNKEAISQAIQRFNKSLSLLSDSESPDDFALVWDQAAGHRRKMGPDSLTRPRKPDLRIMIDRWDKQLLTSLGRRIEIVRKIGKLKSSQSAPILDPDREKRMMVQRKEWGKLLNLPQEFVDDLFAVILKHSSRIQSEL